ncbi:MAG: thymidine phosphorylase [Thermoleophilia bacterium]
MNVAELIAAKRSGAAHSPREIRALIEGYTTGSIPDYQMSAWLMAVCFRGLDREETLALTTAMVASGDTVDLSGVGAGHVADKHSTGGVGDKVSLILGPLVAACGVPFAKMSGRGLGHTGGTVDKLESIPGFRTEMSATAFRRQVEEVGVAIIGQTPGLVPADRLLYALRDVTATVEQGSLIASSVMSKKIAAGATAIVLDVKVGGGAFLNDVGSAREVARTMIELGVDAGRRVRAVLTMMDEPLGRAVGNALEVKEAMKVLRGEGPQDVVEVVLTLAAHLLTMTGGAVDTESARRLARVRLSDGSAAVVARRWVEAQGGDPAVVEGRGLPEAPVISTVPARNVGCVQRVEALAVARACLALGAGREVKGATIDHSVGVEIVATRGTWVEPGDSLAVTHARSESAARDVEEMIRSAFLVGPERPDMESAVMEEIDGGVT